MANDKPVGKPYSEVYLERGAAVEDSARFRNRLRAHLADLPDGWRQEVAKTVGKKTGATVHYANIAKHFTECPLPDLLSNITHAYTALKGIVYHSGGTRP